MALSFHDQYGFNRSDVTLANWRSHPWSRWAYAHVSELVPSAAIHSAAPSADERIGDPYALLSQPLKLRGQEQLIADMLEQTCTDAFVVLKKGQVIADYYGPHQTPQSQHIIFSVGKSLTGILAGIAEDDGKLDPAAPIVSYVPEIAGSAYEDATVRHLLDMCVSLDLEESYDDPSGNYARYRRAALWAPQDGETPLTVIDFLRSLQKGPRDHGEVFCYTSPNADLLGVIIERTTGQRYADFATERLWKPLGARQHATVTVDATGTARAAGGLSMTVRDLARVGEMMRSGGVSTTGERIVSAAWINDTVVATDGNERALNNPEQPWLPNGTYRNQWYRSGNGYSAFMASGVHGQWLYVNPKDEIVIVKLSSEHAPTSYDSDETCVAIFEGISVITKFETWA